MFARVSPAHKLSIVEALQQLASGASPNSKVVLVFHFRDLERQGLGGDPPAARESHRDVTIELGAPANPPGFDEQLVGRDAGGDNGARDGLAGTDLSVTGLRRAGPCGQYA